MGGVAHLGNQRDHHRHLRPFCYISPTYWNGHQVQRSCLWNDHRICTPGYGVHGQREEVRGAELEEHHPPLGDHHAWSIELHCTVLHLSCCPPRRRKDMSNYWKKSNVYK